MFYSYCSSFTRPARSSALLALAVLAALAGAPARADDSADVTKLMRAGQYGEALSRVDSALAQHPRDAQLRFLKGLILTEKNKSAEAIVVFTKLSEDYPELPEPYNNLAVLYASNGQYDKARTALEMAIRTNPTYATAHENLGDIYARLASQAYDKALQLDSANNSAKSKLTLVRTLVANPGAVAPVAPRPVAKSNPAPALAPAIAAKPEPKPPVVAKVEPKPPVVVAKADTKPASAKASASASADSKAESRNKAESKADAEREEVLKSVHGWAKAWSAKDVKGYLASYDNDFQTPKGETRKAWAEERRMRIVGKGTISVRVESPQVSIDGNTATVKFRQVYVSDRLTANSRKTVTLVKQGGKWLIKQERAAS